MRLNIDQLNSKIANLESSKTHIQPSFIVAQVFQETFERKLCSQNLLAYNVPESSYSSSQHISDDKENFLIFLKPLAHIFPYTMKLVRLGKVILLNITNNIRPIKVIFPTKDDVAKLLQVFLLYYFILLIFCHHMYLPYLI